MKKTISIVLVLVLVLVMAGLAQAATITVGPGVGYDFEAIQIGIDAANDADIVLVAHGEYVITEPITFRGKAITVRSEAGRDETTIRMGTPADINRASVVVFENNETAASVLEGFTITDGKGCKRSDPYPPGNRWSGLAGGGIMCWETSPTIFACTITQNTAAHGGGVFCLNSDTILTDCIVENCSTTENGGGLTAVSGSSLILTDCIIRGNSAPGAAGGVFSWDNSSVTMTGCTIAENSAGQAGGGVLSGENSSSVTMTHCAIVGNTAGIGGGGLETWHQASATVTNCVIAQNTTVRGGGIICAPYGYQGCSMTVTNSIIWGNNASQGREIRVENPATFSISYSNVDGGQTGVSVGSHSTFDWGTGNIDADPCFSDPNNDDYHLKSQAGRWDPNNQSWIQDDVTSPCIDAGNPDSDWTAELWPHGVRTNMGAYGGTLHASRSLSDAGNAADLNQNGIVDSADMCLMVDHWHLYEPYCDIAPAPFGDGIVDVQDLIVLAENLFEVYPWAETVEVNEDNDGGQIELELGKLLVVTLESNPSTGYRWELLENNEPILKQLGEAEFKSSETSEPPMVGAGGWEIFRFKAVSAGQMILELVYHRSWEDVEPLKTFSIQVVVP